VPLESPPVISSRMDFDGCVTSLEAIWIVFRDLLGRIITQLERRQRGVRELEVRFDRPYAAPVVKTIRLSRASRDPVNLFNLFRCATDNLEPPDASEGGFVGMRLLVKVDEPLGHAQVDLLDGETYAGEMELDRLIERLCVRLGEDAITQPQPVESHIPERAYCSPLARETRDAQSVALLIDPKIDPSEMHPPTGVRPLHLLPTPVEIRVMVDPFNDAYGRPMQFARSDRVHQLSQVVGPERIAGQWWDGHNKTRDYFDVEDEAGKRFWVFRVNETRRWFLHGRFA
jgi:protein ImuB